MAARRLAEVSNPLEKFITALGAAHNRQWDQPPCRFIAGVDAIAVVEQRGKHLPEQIDAYRDLSTSLVLNDVESAGNKR